MATKAGNLNYSTVTRKDDDTLKGRVQRLAWAPQPNLLLKEKKNCERMHMHASMGVYTSESIQPAKALPASHCYPEIDTENNQVQRIDTCRVQSGFHNIL